MSAYGVILLPVSFRTICIYGPRNVYTDLQFPQIVKLTRSRRSCVSFGDRYRGRFRFSAGPRGDFNWRGIVAWNSADSERISVLEPSPCALHLYARYSCEFPAHFPGTIEEWYRETVVRKRGKEPVAAESIADRLAECIKRYTEKKKKNYRASSLEALQNRVLISQIRCHDAPSTPFVTCEKLANGIMTLLERKSFSYRNQRSKFRVRTFLHRG